MPPIPKFAKALAEFAKANPKAIPGETIPKIKEKNISEKTIETSPEIKKRNTSEKTTEKQIKTKKFAKDDMELYKIRREKTKKELEQILPKKAKDDSELLLVAKQFEKIDATKIQETEFNKYANKLKIFFNKAKFLLKDKKGTGQIIEYIDDMNKYMELFKKPNIITEDTVNEVQTIANKIRDESIKIKG